MNPIHVSRNIEEKPLMSGINYNDFLILVVDDISDNLQFIGNLLEEAGYETTFATSGQQAIERVKNARPALVLLDLMMPDINGIEVCSILKSNPNYKDIPIIFLTASHETTHLVQAFQQGAVDYITKPFKAEEIIVRIKNQLRLYTQEKQLIEQNIQLQNEIQHRITVEAALEEKATQLEQALHELKSTQVELIQSKKMSSLGQIVAGIAHEINNPASFIMGNINHAVQYFHDFNHLVKLYQKALPDSTPEINEFIEEIDLDFLVDDWEKMMNSIKLGAERLYQIVCSLRNFSRLGEAEIKSVDIHQGIDNALLILQHRLQPVGARPEIQIIKDYGQLPNVMCYPSQLNQVFLYLLANAIDAVEKVSGVMPTITIRTELIREQNQQEKNNPLPETDVVKIYITDNGIGIDKKILANIFDPFFTTKPVGNGTGLGLSISHQIIVDKHKGQIHCHSTPVQGTTFIVTIPLTILPYSPIKCQNSRG